MTLHKDYDTNETTRTKAVSMAADYIATVWEQSTPDKPYSRTFLKNGKKVRVSVGLDEQTLRERIERELAGG